MYGKLARYMGVRERVLRFTKRTLALPVPDSSNRPTAGNINCCNVKETEERRRKD
jgi:hypothetical protein